MNENRIETLEERIKVLKKKNRNLGSVIAILVLIILGLILFIYLDKNNGIVCEEPKANQEEVEESSSDIEINNDLIADLRKLIPRVEKCNTYYHGQFSEKKFTSTDKIEELDSCNDYMIVTYVFDKATSKGNEVYIYDYVLIKNKVNATDNKLYGKTYDNIEYYFNDLFKDKEILTEEIIKEKGAKYKYTFKQNDDKTFSYVSTEIIKED